MAAGCPFITCAVKKKGIEFCWDCEENKTCEKWKNFFYPKENPSSGFSKFSCISYGSPHYSYLCFSPARL